jgi:ferric-dicitrate binding protein FerR (iron transport regulator)
MDDQIDSRLLERFLAGDCTDEEREQVVRWVDGIPERQVLLNTLRTTWTRLGTPPRTYDAPAAWSAVEARLRKPAATGATPNESRHPSPLPADPRVHTNRPRLHAIRETAPRFGWRVAATVLVTVGLASAAVWWSGGGPSPRGRATVAAAREVVTPRGQRATIHLADGSTVTLAPASRLRESPTFDVDARDVWLDGEAYFEVVHDAAKPFRVHTARAVAQGLGTKFLVRAYAESPDVRVVVADGLVSLRRARDSATARSTPTAVDASADSLLLRPRDLGRLDAEGRLTSQPGVALDDYTAWTSGRLVFTDTPLRDAIPRLGRWYDVELRLGDADLGRETFTATLTHEPLSDVVRLLAATVRARVEQRGDTLVLVRRRVPQ